MSVFAERMTIGVGMDLMVDFGGSNQVMMCKTVLQRGNESTMFRPRLPTGPPITFEFFFFFFLLLFLLLHAGCLFSAHLFLCLLTKKLNNFRFPAPTAAAARTSPCVCRCLSLSLKRMGDQQQHLRGISLLPPRQTRDERGSLKP